MTKNSSPMKEHTHAAHVAASALIAVLPLIFFSATALAGFWHPKPGAFVLAQASTLQPTRSPTFQRIQPGSTPVSAKSSSPGIPSTQILGQPQVDQYTVALYHFDDQIGQLVPEATGRYTGTLYGSAAITTSGLYGGALQTNGNGSYMRTGWLGNMPQGTIEAYVDFVNIACPGQNGEMISAGSEYGSGTPVLSLRYNGYMDFQLLTPSGWVIASSGISCRYLRGDPLYKELWPYDVWRFHHVAATWGPRGMEIWVDGVLHGVGYNGIIPGQPNGVPTTYDSGGGYWCNPQTQTGLAPWPTNTYYPLCPPPLATVPASPSPPGDYGGGLGSYSTFLIGCDAAAACFPGRIDEVRISNIQRTFTTSVDPTSTPTPTQTPNLVSGAFSPDANTLMLHHFDSQTNGIVHDAINNQPGYLCSPPTSTDPCPLSTNAITTTGKFNSGVYLNGSASYVNLQNLSSSAVQGAAEAWIKLSGGSTPVLLHEGAGFGSYWEVLLLGVGNAYSTFGFGLQTRDNVWHWVDSKVAPAALVGSWHHVAGTWGNRGLEIWIDGQLCATNSSLTYFDHDWSSPFLGGCDEHGNCMQGTMDELRISNIQRSYQLAPGVAPMRLYSPLSLPYQYFFPLMFSRPGFVPVKCGSLATPAKVWSVP